MLSSVLCLATVIFFEARSESVVAQEAVASVVLNRVEDPRYPNTVCGVVFEPTQLSFTHDGLSDNMFDHEDQPERVAILDSLKLAVTMLETGPLLTSTHYHTTVVSPSWGDIYDLDGLVGNHLFYTNSTPYR